MPAWTLLLSCRPPSPATPTELGGLREGQAVEGFTVEALYVDDDERPLGVRLVHARSGLGLALFQLQTAPQAYMWVDTVPNDDRGEPHTQEHLLLGKGNKGRGVATLEDMSLVGSSAFTQRLRTAYHFHTTAGPATFFDVLQARLDALLHPDYTDEEIRREVHHYGVRADPSDGHLVLEEKGTVYNEMDSSFQNPGANLWRKIGQDMYGEAHPIALSSGGVPAAIRTMTPQDIRAFHAANYHLGNMGMIAVLPTDVPLPVALARLDEVLVAAEPEAPGSAFRRADDLPPPEPAADRTLRHVVFPNGDASASGSVVVAFPPTRDLPLQEHMLLQILLAGLAGDDSSNLYRAMVDSTTRERDLEATDVWGWASDDLGQPAYVGVQGIPAGRLTDDVVEWIAARVQRELARVAALPAGDPELADLMGRLQAEAVQVRRGVRSMISSPPAFGYRGTGSSWFDLLDSVDRVGGPVRSLTLAPQLGWIVAELARTDNPWAEYLPAWGLLSDPPLVYVNKPSPEALRALSTERQERLQAQTAALVAEYGVDDAQAALGRFREDYDRDTAELEAAWSSPDLAFVASPPLTYDDPLQWSVSEIADVPTVAARFEAMTGADVRLSLSLRGIAPEHEAWLGVLPELLTEVGVLIDGVPVPHTEVSDRLKREVLAAWAALDHNARVGRAELVLGASGTDPTEVEAALRWVHRFLDAPDWRPENLARIRDVVEAERSSLAQRMLGREESWVQIPAAAWRFGRDRLQLRTWSFLTQAHDVERLLWRLTDPGDGTGPAAAGALADAAGTLDREGLIALLTVLQGRQAEPPLRANRFLVRAEALAPAAAERLGQLAGHLERHLADIPDEALVADWRYLCERLAADWDEAPSGALAELDALLGSLRHQGRARVVVAAGPLLDDLDGPLEELLRSSLAPGRGPENPPVTIDVVRGRLADRGADAGAIHVGLLDPNRRSGVHLHSAPMTSIDDTDPDAVLALLAINAWAGGGAHGLFMKTWGAGLAYSNGIRPDPASGRVSYYAERCPSLGQTMDFVIDEIEGASIDDAIAEYAVAQVFHSRSASAYPSRAAALADDLVDGNEPPKVERFREAVLTQRGRPGLAAELQARIVPDVGRVLPGIPPATADVEGATSFVIGDAGQLQGWAAWLQAHEGGGALQWLYPRDFWVLEPVER